MESHLKDPDLMNILFKNNKEKFTTITLSGSLIPESSRCVIVFFIIHWNPSHVNVLILVFWFSRSGVLIE